MTDQEFEAIRKLLQDQSGIILEDGKQYLVETRLAPLLQQLKLKTLGDLVLETRSPRGAGLKRQIVEAMVTSESLFFRDHHPFQALRKTVLPDLLQRRRDQRRLNIWCAASAYGQEPYSVAMLIREHFPELASWNITLLATDISREVLARARAGRYSQIEVNRGLPAAFLVKYFTQHGTDWELKQVIRSMVDFQEINLTQAWPSLPPMDLVLVRNVMIYFEVTTKKTILGKMARLLQPDGYLLLGGAETTFNLDESFERVEPLNCGMYQLANRPTRAVGGVAAAREV
jgi:chemotaxis protein methyltransferase CheR